MKALISTLIAVQLAILAWFWRFLPPQVPLFYSRPWGEEQLATPVFLTLMPGLSGLGLVLVVLVNYLAVGPDKFVVRIIEAAALLLAVFNLVTLIQIIRLVS